MGAVTRADIAARAYQIWETEGRPNGQEVRHWLEAETELSAAVEPPVVAMIPRIQKSSVRPRPAKKRQGARHETSGQDAAKLSP